MPEHGSQSVRRRRLAAELRRLRERVGLTGDEAADRLGWSGSKISRIETHRIGVKPADLKKLLDLYEVDIPYRDELQALARESPRTGWLDSVTAGFDADYRTYLYAEAEASSLSIWDPQIVPGLMQTDSYARALLLGYQTMFTLPPGDAERRIDVRRVRQQQLLSRDPPLELSVVIDESVLYRRFGDNSVMREQLLRLTELSTLANVKLLVLPLAGTHPIGTGAFSYLQFQQVQDISLGDMVEVEHLTRSYYLEHEDQTFQYQVTFRRLAATSVDEDQSRAMIDDAVRTHWT